MKKRRFMALLLATAMTASMAAGAVAVHAEEAINAEELEPVHLTWYFVGNGEVPDSEMVNEAISEYVKEKINATVEIICLDWSSYDQKMASMIAAGEPFDLLFTAGWAMNYQVNAHKGAFLPIDDLLEEYGQGIIETMGMAPIDGNRVNGLAYGVPVYKEMAHAEGIYLNKKYVDKYGFDIDSIKTIQDMEPMFEVIKDEPEILSNLDAASDYPNSLMRLLNYNYVSGDGRIPGALHSNNDPDNVTVFNQYATPEFKEILDLTREYFERGYIRADAATVENEILEPQGVCFTTWNSIKPGGDKESSNANVDWVQVQFTDPVMASYDVGNALQCISSTSENPERAMMLLNLMYTDKTLVDMVNYGIEGVHYDRISENVVEPYADSNYYAGGSISWQFGSQFLVSLKSNEDPDKYEQFQKFNDEALILDALGFNFNPDAVQTEISAVVNVIDEYCPVLLTGSVEPDEYYPEFVAKMEEAGSEVIIAEIQRQYDEFLASK